MRLSEVNLYHAIGPYRDLAKPYVLVGLVVEEHLEVAEVMENREVCVWNI